MEESARPQVSAFDVAAEWRARLGPIGDVRLHKLLYYSQAWHVTWYGGPLFVESIEAWSLGPVVAALWKAEKYADVVPVGDPDRLTTTGRAVLNFVEAQYGGMSGTELSELSHRERPWVAARELAGAETGQASSVPIDLAVMRAFYREQDAADQAWYWLDDWQHGESEAATEVQSQPMDANEFLASL